MTATDPKPKRPPGLLRRTWRKRWVPILTRWAVLTVALMCAVYVMRPFGPYRAVSLLRIDPKVTDLYGVRNDRESPDAFLQTQALLITSPAVLAAAAENPKLVALPRISQAADKVEELRKLVNVSVVPGTYLLQVSVELPTATETATIVNAVADAFMDANSEWSDGMTRVQIRNLENYNVELKNSTDELERRWKTLVAKGDADLKAKGANLISPEQGAKIEQKLVDNDLARLEAQAQLDAIQARPIKDEAKLEELRLKIDIANRLESALRERRASGGYEPRTAATDAVEIKLVQEQRNSLKAMQESVIRRLEQLRYQAKGEARIRPVNANGAMVPGRPLYDRRPMLMTIIPFATFALVFACFAGIEARSTSKAPVGPTSPDVAGGPDPVA